VTGRGKCVDAGLRQHDGGRHGKKVDLNSACY